MDCCGGRYGTARTLRVGFAGQVGEDEEIIQRANVDEKVRRTTPIGMYPLGVSQPYGLWDVTGNVWEWQANYSDKEHNFLALGGGSWDYPHDSARLSARHGNRPNLGWSNYGFRVVVFPVCFELLNLCLLISVR